MLVPRRLRRGLESVRALDQVDGHLLGGRMYLGDWKEFGAAHGAGVDGPVVALEGGVAGGAEGVPSGPVLLVVVEGFAVRVLEAASRGLLLG